MANSESHPMLFNSLNELTFDNRFTATLPGDTEFANYCRDVFGAHYSLVTPSTCAKPGLVAYSKDVARLIDLSPDACESAQFTRVFSGNEVLPSMKPFSMCYGGHQFGNWAGQLGDGRAINLGEVINQDNKRWILQLKGAGLTPYSRNADGLAVLRSSVREFLCSEAMYYLGVPTTRALSLILTGDKVMRDMLYDGNPELEPGAVVCRVAPSFLRFGNFQLPVSRRDLPLLESLLHYTIKTDFPHLGEPDNDVILQWFTEVCDRTLDMVIHWMRVGFVHGVMNTDNMSILGLTIDYGPYGWLESYDPQWTPNTTDAGGKRYRYEHQPQMAHWNLLQLANAIFPIVKNAPALELILNNFVINYERRYLQMQLSKLGLQQSLDNDDALIAELVVILQLVETDMTLFYRQLAKVDLSALEQNDYRSILNESYYHPDQPNQPNQPDQPDQLNEEYWQQLHAWLHLYAQRCEAENLDADKRASVMNSVNPLYVLRNYLAQLAIDKAENGDYSGIEELMDVLTKPYVEQTGKAHLAEKRPEWARNKVGCSMLSCSS